jgi:hypothetical protein
MRRRYVVTTVGLLLTAAGAASAYLTGGGGGTATAATSIPLAVTISPGAPSAALRPGGATDIVLTATNQNVGQARLTSLVLDTARGTAGFAVDTDHAGCTTSSFSLSAPSYDAGGAGWTVPGASGGNPGTLALTLTQALTMALDAPNACQGATVTVFLKAGS